MSMYAFLATTVLHTLHIQPKLYAEAELWDMCLLNSNRNDYQIVLEKRSI